MSSHRAFPISDNSQVGEARRIATRVSQEAGLTDVATGKVALLVTELATNLLRHAQRGELLIRALCEARRKGMEVLSIDRGPGMPDAARCMSDGFSTGGTSGIGLGTVSRVASEFEIYSEIPNGTVIFSRIWEGAQTESPMRYGVVCVPAPNESVCGDGWRVANSDDASAFVMSDGLGHGPLAAEASEAVSKLFDADPFMKSARFFEAAHGTLRSTRGAAVATAHLNRSEYKLHFTGVGNISGTIVSEGGRRGLFSHDGTVGMQIRKVQDFEYDWAPGSTLILHSDGLQTRWDLSAYPGLSGRHPGIIAAVLYRDFKRGKDDATVLVAA